MDMVSVGFVRGIGQEDMMRDVRLLGINIFCADVGGRLHESAATVRLGARKCWLRFQGAVSFCCIGIRRNGFGIAFLCCEEGNHWQRWAGGGCDLHFSGLIVFPKRRIWNEVNNRKQILKLYLYVLSR